MKVVTEVSLEDFEAWSGGADVLNTLKCSLSGPELEALENQIVECIGDEDGNVDETTLNDFLWFESDSVANMLGYDDWDSFCKHTDEDEEEEDEDDSDEETDDEEG